VARQDACASGQNRTRALSAAVSSKQRGGRARALITTSSRAYAAVEAERSTSRSPMAGVLAAPEAQSDPALRSFRHKLARCWTGSVSSLHV